MCQWHVFKEYRFLYIKVFSIVLNRNITTMKLAKRAQVPVSVLTPVTYATLALRSSSWDIFEPILLSFHNRYSYLPFFLRDRIYAVIVLLLVPTLLCRLDYTVVTLLSLGEEVGNLPTEGLVYKAYLA